MGPPAAQLDTFLAQPITCFSGDGPASSSVETRRLVHWVLQQEQHQETPSMRRLASKIWQLVWNKDTTKHAARPGRPTRRRLELEALESRYVLNGTFEPATAVLSGLAFVDTNNNGARDAGEIALAGIDISLSGPARASTRTDTNGAFTFFNLPAGTYQLERGAVSELLSGQNAFGNLGGTRDADAIATIEVEPGQVGLNYLFAVRGLAPAGISMRQFLNSSTTALGFLPPPGSPTFADNSTLALNPTGTGALSGFVYADANANANGSREPSEPGLVGAQVALTGVAQLGNAMFLTATTDPGGAYQFSNLAPGLYALNVVSLPAGFRAGLPTIATPGGKARGNDQVSDIKVTSNSTGEGYNFAALPALSLPSGTVAVVAQLANDTAGPGGTASDGLTSDPVVRGQVSGSVVSFRAGLDSAPEASFSNVLGNLGPGSAFFLNAARVAQLAGGTLADGSHTLHLVAQDALGNVARASVAFILDRTAPATPSFGLDAASDTGIPNDQRTDLATVTLVGQAAPGALVRLLPTGTTATANGAGQFSFTNVALAQGPTDFTVVVIDAAGNRSDKTVTVVRNTAPVVSAQLDDITVQQNAPDRIIDLAGFFNDADLSNSIVKLNTNLGPIKVELFDSQPRKTVTNFFNYASDGDYNNAIFHRSESNFVLQGGGFKFVTNPSNVVPITSDGNVANEFDSVNRPNTRGTIAMAKTDDPNSATNQFYFNLNNNPGLDSPLNSGGFTVFGRVADGGDQRVVDSLVVLPTQNRTNFNSAFARLPLQNFEGNFPADARADNFALIEGVEVLRRSEKLTYAITNSNTFLVFATIADNRLKLDFAPTGTGTATITVTATDQHGATVQDTFVVTVS
jgi:cyclophilin family peptidyl-prolyl cis-trans isomerase